MSNITEEEEKNRREALLAALSNPDMEQQVKLRLLERYYHLPVNLNGLKSDLYYDLMEKYHSMKQVNKQQAMIITELINLRKATGVDLSEEMQEKVNDLKLAKKEIRENERK